MVQWHKFGTKGDMVAALKSAISERLLTAVLKDGNASWAVSGGSTPAPLFEAMSQVGLDWSRIQIALVDERWVAPDHPRSNEAFMKQALKKSHAVRARFIGMKTPHETPALAVRDVNDRYRALKLPFDSILLGMGPDGHTASLFPGAEGLEQAFDPARSEVCAALTANKSDVTGNELDRMSLTASAIMAAPHVVLMITGEAKKQRLEEAISTESDLPIARLARLKPFDVYWAP